MKYFDVIILGGGAAGLMCALTAGQRGRRVAVLERANKIGKKILMSGGGRCNFTNLHTDPEAYLSANPHFCKSALARYTQWDFIALVEKYGIAYHEKTLGQLFCDESAKQIVAMLLAECKQAGVDIFLQCETQQVTAGQGFALTTNEGDFAAESLVVATGGLSIPKMGGSGLGYELARQFGLAVEPTSAGLVPFTFSDSLLDICQRLAGVSVWATVTTARASFTEGLLFTHRGISGPSVLQASSYWQSGEIISIDLLPGQQADALLRLAKQEQPKMLLRSLLQKSLPKQLVMELEALFWADWAAVKLGEIPHTELDQIAHRLNHWQLKPSGTEGYRTAEVTLGGVDTAGVSSKTLECHTQAGLYFIGEVLDVTGHLGGYNFQWAWASGNVAGQYV